MIGQVLGGRYEIIERIGGGGMALVYKGHDSLLNRKVAVKVLRQQFVHDEEFIRRFRREAQSAASLSHPNVVSIYDVGREQDIHYIVMEYVEGTNLNEKIKEHAPLQVEEAVHIATQICDALDHAHHNQIIHRDIKPHNILIGKNGRVKVTDFGIARAATASDITQTGSVIGSVHYFSPEHAKGVSQGEKSDIYSLGIVMYQMLTGRLPFLGESPISVALKHLQEDVEEPRKVNPMIPQSVENIILKSMRKNPEERYASARDMLHDLETCLLPQKLNEPKIAFSRQERMDEDHEQTRVMPAIRSRRAADSEEEREASVEWKGLESKSGKKNSWIKPVVWFAVIIILLAAMWYGIAYVQKLIKVPDVEVPNVEHMTLEDARTKLGEAGLSASPIEYRFDDNVPNGIVLQQEKSGYKVKLHSSIKLIVSKGKEMAIMQNYKGMLWETVLSEFQAKFNPDQIVKKEVKSDQPAGTIIDQIPVPQEEYDPKTATFTFTVSKGQGTVEMPDLVGMKESAAIALITKSNLKIDEKNIQREKSYFPEGYIFKQWPFEPGAQVDPGQEITIWVSTGLAEDAVEAIKSIAVSPTVEGQNTAVKITVSDAKGERDWKSEDITSQTHYSVPVVVSKKTNAVITIYKDGQPTDSITVTYLDAQRAQQESTFSEGLPSANPSGTGHQPSGGTAASSGKPPAPSGH
ncbi:Stk1 family PASTA domain-containing Ser/Thr kinase [Ferviditalea candida]|uniref:non-specific serine/threonine protein kinase n=1 Tax=Ferviditalea candida TaxID=3108399 RepID=A0ABU5ZJG8_9BACL|nr:Stk1 family PASTA domain-containing Ser/Thr kinase [Paenibacillaceae bacterium T2]